MCVCVFSDGFDSSDEVEEAFVAPTKAKQQVVASYGSYDDSGPVVVVGKKGARERAARKKGTAAVPGAGAVEEPEPAPAPVPAPAPEPPKEFSVSAAAEALDAFLNAIGARADSPTLWLLVDSIRILGHSI